MRKPWITLLLLAGCTAPQPPLQTSHQNDADAAFARLADGYTEGYLAWRPAVGTALGLHQYDGKTTDFSDASIAAELARIKSFDQRLGALDATKLSPSAAYDWRILQSSVRRERFSFEEMQIYTKNPMTYAGAVDLNIYIKRNFAPLTDRVRSIIAILNQTPRIMAAARANLADSLPAPQVEIAIEEADGAIDFLAKDLPQALNDVEDKALLAEFQTADQRAITEMMNFAAWLKDEKLPKATAPFALGRENYAKLLQYGAMDSLSPEQLLEIGQQELQRKQQAFADAAHEIDPAKPPVEVFKAVQNDHPTPESLIPDTARGMEMIRQFVIDRRLVTVPSSVRARATETPQYLRATVFASMDTPGPFETKATEAYYYVTPPEADWSSQQKNEWLTAFNYYTTDIVSIHEAYPGHYVQFLCLNASPATRLEKIFSAYVFVEGWAHYAEQMMVDEGFGACLSASPTRDQQIKAAKYRLAQADEALLRVCRLCVSVKLHCQGMTIAQATRFFQDNCYYEEKTAHQEALRGAYDPEYLYYTLGKLEIFKLREDYRKQEGARFNLQQFHDELLRHGTPPIHLLRERMLKDRSQWDKVLR
jgi:uncharacterized protein (DUF885 family)